MTTATKRGSKAAGLRRQATATQYWRRQTQALNDVVVPKAKDRRCREKAERDIYYALIRYFPHVFYNPLTSVHRAMVEAMLSAIRYGGDYSVAAPRGEGKSSCLRCVVIYCINFGLIKFPLIIGPTRPDAERMLKSIKSEYEFNDRLLADFPEICVPIRALERDNRKAARQTVGGENTHIDWGKDKIVMPVVPGSKASGAVIEIRSPGSAIRGIYHNSPKHGTLRPDLVLIDDIETRESADSQVQREFARDIIEGDLAGLAGQGKRISRVMLCTVWNRQSISWEYTDQAQRPGWGGQRYKLIEKWPDRMDKWDTYVQMRREDQAAGDKKGRRAFRFYQNDRAEMDRGSIATNPHRYIKDLCKDGTQEQLSTIQFAFDFICDHSNEVDPVRFFNEEFQNDPPSLDEFTSGISSHLVQNRLSHYPKGVVPAWASKVTAGIDPGKYQCHWVVTAWSAGAKGVVVDYGVIEVYNAGDTEESVESAIHNALQRWRDETNASPYRDEGGVERPVDLTLIDSGRWPTPVYQFTATAGLSFRPSKGLGESIDGSSKQYSPGNTGDRKKVGDHWYLSRQENGQWLVFMDSDYWKAWVHTRFLTSPDRPSSLALFGTEPYPHFSFAKHLVAEEEVEEWIHGKGMKRFWKRKNRNNHWFDALYQASCAASLCGIRLLDHGEPVFEDASHPKPSRAERRRAVSPMRPGGRPWLPPTTRSDGRRWLDR